ncbi:MAG: LPS export ABC transporter periplasmic protein LptC, partial [Vicinamibacterales bacterium]
MAWQKRLRALLGVVVLLLVAGVGWYVTRQRTETEAPPVSPRTDENADIEISGNEDVRYGASGNVVFRLKYDGGFIYTTQSRVRLVGVTGTLARGNQPVEFRADEAELKLKSGTGMDFAKFDEIRLRGGVVIKSAPGTEALYLETAEALYNDLTGIMTTDKPAKVRRGNMSGSGTGATFDRDRSVVWLLADADVEIAMEGQGPISVTATRAGLAEAEHYMRFEENVRMEREGRVIQTDAALANLTPDNARMTGLELRGNSRITGADGAGGMPNMQADDITITYGAETGLLERAVLMRAARLELPEGEGRDLAAGYIDIGFGGDGTTVVSLDANDAVALNIAAEGDQPAREVRAPRLEARAAAPTGNPARGAVPKGLERARFTGGVDFDETAPARRNREAIEREGRAESLELALDGGFGKITDADFSGNVRFTDRDVRGEAPDAQYGLETKRILLRGGTAVARVVQEDGTVEAKDIDLTLDPRKMTAKGNPVKSTLKPGARKDRKEPRPSILEDDEPVNITSRMLDYNGVADRAVYTGDARLWQGDTVIQAETIVLDDKTGNLEARKNMRGTFIIRDEPEPGAKAGPPPKPTQVNADDMIYDESRREATFRTKARFRGPEGDMTADRIVVFLREDGNTLDRIEAYDDITARLEGGRVATGLRLTYNAKTRRYTMEGKPLVVRRQFPDKAAGGAIRCEKTEGASLTFDRSADTFDVHGANRAMVRAVPIPCGAKLPLP